MKCRKKEVYLTKCDHIKLLKHHKRIFGYGRKLLGFGWFLIELFFCSLFMVGHDVELIALRRTNSQNINNYLTFLGWFQAATKKSSNKLLATTIHTTSLLNSAIIDWIKKNYENKKCIYIK